MTVDRLTFCKVAVGRNVAGTGPVMYDSRIGGKPQATDPTHLRIL